MIYPRLYLARNLLKDDGVIFITMDDHEVDNLRKVCNEVFGEENFIATVIWQKGFHQRILRNTFPKIMTTSLSYARNAEVWRPRLLP